MMFLLKQRPQYGKQLTGQLIAFPMVVVPDLKRSSNIFGSVGFPVHQLSEEYFQLHNGRLRHKKVRGRSYKTERNTCFTCNMSRSGEPSEKQ